MLLPSLKHIKGPPESGVSTDLYKFDFMGLHSSIHVACAILLHPLGSVWKIIDQTYYEIIHTVVCLLYLLHFVTMASCPEVTRPFSPHPVTQTFCSLLPALPMTNSKEFSALFTLI